MRMQSCPTNVRSFEVLCQRLTHPSILLELVWFRHLRKLRGCVELYEALLALAMLCLLIILEDNEYDELAA